MLTNDDYGKLGFYSLAVLYFFIGIGSMMSTAIMNKIGVKASMVLGGLGHFSWVFSFNFAALKYCSDCNINKELFIFSNGFIFAFMMLCAMLNGFGAAILWVAQGNYISDCAPEEKKGFFFSYFWSFYMFSQVSGNLIGAFVIG